VSVHLTCEFCGADWEFEGKPGHLQQLVAIEMGHVMPTLGLAIAHMICARCDRTRLKLSAGRPPAQTADLHVV
jgi:hypothetical protein